MEVRKVKLFNKVNVKEVKNFSLRSQRANLVSSKSDKSKEVKTPLQTHITGTRCEHDRNVCVTKFVRSHMRALLGGLDEGYAKSKKVCQKSQRSQIS